MKREIFAVADIYVPVKRRTTLEQKRVVRSSTRVTSNGCIAPLNLPNFAAMHESACDVVDGARSRREFAWPWSQKEAAWLRPTTGFRQGGLCLTIEAGRA
jgi:hypothetical protein